MRVYRQRAVKLISLAATATAKGQQTVERSTMRKVIVAGLGVVTILALTSAMALAEPMSPERCKHNADVCVRNSVKCSNPAKCEERCFFKWDLCDAGTPLPGASAQSIPGRGPTQKSAIGLANGAAASIAAPVSTSLSNVKSASAATASTLNGASAILSQPSVSLQPAPRSGAPARVGGGAQLNAAGAGPTRMRQP